MSSLEVIPAIDLLGGRCVRLSQGDYDRVSVYGEDPGAVAEGFVRIGAQRVHTVDLDGARACGFQTAFVRRPDEWGPGGPPDPNPNPAYTIVVDDFSQLAERLGA